MMAISFTCRRCATRFKVSDGLKGKKARCKKCGSDLRVPEVPAPAVASTGLFRMGAVQADRPAAKESPPAASEPRPSAAPASLRLAPISADFVKPASRQRTPESEADSIEYEMERPHARPVPKPPAHLSPSSGRLFWGPGGIAESLLIGLRKISDLAYFVSIAFLLAILLAIILKQRELALIAAVVVILLNVARFAIDGFVLVMLAFKNGLVRGVLFFVPPFTLYYLSKRKVMQEAFSRFLGPALPILGVVLLFAFVPWLRGGEDSEEASAGADTPARQESKEP